MENMTSATRMGRPRGFDEKAALDAAMRVFWEKSYEGATLTDLTEAMGINRSSMYAAFGDKEALFRLVIARYRDGPELRSDWRRTFRKKTTAWMWRLPLT
jgi:AcrR family transcriptional regulator